MPLLEEFERSVCVLADGRFDAFMKAFLTRRIGRSSGSNKEVLRALEASRVSTIKKLTELQFQTGDQSLKASIARYAECLRWAGYYEDGSGGPRNLPSLTSAEKDCLCEQLYRVKAELRRSVAVIRRCDARVGRGFWLRRRGSEDQAPMGLGV